MGLRWGGIGNGSHNSLGRHSRGLTKPDMICGENVPAPS